MSAQTGRFGCSTGGRPAEPGCRMESACGTCACLRTGPGFLPILTRRCYLETGDGRTTAAGVASARAGAALAVYPVLCHTLGAPGRESRAGTR
jgi:hypothetical protein